MAVVAELLALWCCAAVRRTCVVAGAVALLVLACCAAVRRTCVVAGVAALLAFWCWAAVRRARVVAGVAALLAFWCWAAVRRTCVVAGAAALLALACCAAVAQAADRIDTVAGSGTGGFGGDGGPAVAALLTTPSDVAVLDGGSAYLIADTSNHRIRRVGADGAITTVAGAGPAVGAPGTFGGDGGLATGSAARLNLPRGVSPTADGGFLIADTENHRIRAVSPAGVITTVAGNGTTDFGGDGDAATGANLRFPGGVAALPDGGFLIADTGNNRIRRVQPGPGGLISTVAGSGTAAFGGDGSAATAAALNAPARVVPLTGGGFLIADTGNNRIRRVDLNGTIATVAGSAAPTAFGGDGGPATAAALNQPEGVAVRPDGAIVIADSGNERIREVDAAGTIRTIAGNGSAGFGGDGGPPTAAQLSHPRAVAVSDERLRIADAFNHRIRAVTPERPVGRAPPVAPPTADPPTQVPPGVAPPVLGKTAVATPIRGVVRIRLRGTRRFVALDSVASIPLGSELDTTRGTVLLLFATTRAGRKASAMVSEGRFVLRQPAAARERGQRPGVLVLSGPLVGCRARLIPVAAHALHPGGRPRATARASSAPLAFAAKRRGGRRPHAAVGATSAPLAFAAKRRKRGRRLRVEADGAIKTQGRYGAAIVRGTRWTMVDRCPRRPRSGTFVAVAEGRVAVRSFALRRTVLVRAGKRFLAPARRP